MICKNILFDILLNNSASRAHRRMKILPFEPARRDESNGGILILLRVLDAELFDKMPIGTIPKSDKNERFVEYLGI